MKLHYFKPLAVLGIASLLVLGAKKVSGNPVKMIDLQVSEVGNLKMALPDSWTLVTKNYVYTGDCPDTKSSSQDRIDN